MALRDIVLFGEPVLRVKADKVESFDDDLSRLVDDMIETMEVAEGIGLAAPQVGKSLALCVVNNYLIDDDAEPKAYINPEVCATEGSVEVEEGCLSIPDIREDVTRPEKIEIKYFDLEGKEHTETCDGMLARVLQHEIDHLNGVLFIDRISSIKRQLLAKRLKQIALEAKNQNSPN